MIFCPNCGASVEGRFCAKCGTAVPAAGTTPGGQQAHRPPQDFGQPAAAAGLSTNVASGLCYVLGIITGVLFLVLAPYNQDRNVRFHAFQSIFFHAAVIGLWIVETIIAIILPWSLSVVVSLLWFVLMVGGLVVWVLLLVKAFQGERFKLPVIGDLAEKQA